MFRARWMKGHKTRIMKKQSLGGAKGELLKYFWLVTRKPVFFLFFFFFLLRPRSRSRSRSRARREGVGIVESSRVIDRSQCGEWRGVGSVEEVRVVRRSVGC